MANLHNLCMITVDLFQIVTIPTTKVNIFY